MNTFGPLTRISPSSAILISHCENGLPTVPNLNASGREIVAESRAQFDPGVVKAFVDREDRLREIRTRFAA